MITATQEKFIPAPGRHGMVYVDTCIVAHSNEAEWQKFKADHTNEAILDRIVVVKVPYNLRLSEEVKIYKKIIGALELRRLHRAAHARDRLDVRDPVAARADRQVRPDDQAQASTTARRSSRRAAPRRSTSRELRDDTKREGMFGISTRFIMKALDNALSQNPKSIHPINVREALIDMVKEADLAEDVKKQLPRVPAGHAAQGLSRAAREGDHQGVRLLLPGAGRDAVPELPRPRRGLREQDQGEGPQHPRGAAAGRGVPQVDRGADRDHRLGRRRLPPGGDRLPVGRRRGAASGSPTPPTSRSRRRSRGS